MVNIWLFFINKKCHVTTVSFVYGVVLIKKKNIYLHAQQPLDTS